jgi:RNA polymerase sigma-70 factor (ECF subfamily)
MALLPEPDTNELLDRVAGGDVPARERLFERHLDRLGRLVELRMDRRLAARVDGSDIVQETLAEAAQRLPDYLRERPLPFYPWVRQLALRQLADQYRRHVQAGCRSVTREAPGDLPLSDRSAAVLAARLKADDTGPSEKLLRKELVAAVRAVLGRLDPADREVLVLRYVEQVSTRDAAAIMGLTAEGLKSRQRRALERFSRLVGELMRDGGSQ